MFWPEDLSQKAAKLSVIPLLLNTQDQFLGILSIRVASLEKLFELIRIAELPANLFVKHLMILADFGGEILQRINDNFNALFPNKTLRFHWRDQLRTYRFQNLPLTGRLTNSKLWVSGKKLTQGRELDGLLQDIIVLLIFGSASSDPHTAEVLSKCQINGFLGHPEALKQFVKQRYIWVSRITAGSQTNDLGQLAQKFVQEYLQDHLNIKDVEIHANGNLPGVSHNDEAANRPTSFDIVVSKNNQYVAIEVGFQVTTNSVIERKAGQAQARYNQINEAGYKMTYILDGAGNFQRENAMRTLCAHSHCTVAFSKSELGVLCQFIREYLR